VLDDGDHTPTFIKINVSFVDLGLLGPVEDREHPGTWRPT